MVQRLIDDLKDSAGRAMRLTTLAAAAAVALLITTSFLCAAAFVFVLDNYGPVQACLAGAAIFFVITLIAAGGYMARKRKSRARVAQQARAASHNMLADPMVVAAGLQLVRSVGVKRMIPIIAIAGIALGLMAARGTASTTEEPAE